MNGKPVSPSALAAVLSLVVEHHLARPALALEPGTGG